jgi:hypothetical protein
MSNNSKVSLNDQESSTQTATTILRRDTEEYKLVKKLPNRFSKRFNDIYITNKTDFKLQIKKCQKILTTISSKPPPSSSNEKESYQDREVVLHAIGPAINRLFIFNSFWI